jgi:hypothetical protein
MTMTRFDGTAARQLDFLEGIAAPATPARRPAAPGRATMRLLQRDLYAELARRRRRAQIAARRAIEKP